MTRSLELGASLPSAPAVQGDAHLDLLMEGMFDAWERLLAIQTLLSQLAAAVAAFSPLRYNPSRTKDQVFAPTTASPVSAAHLAPAGVGLMKSMVSYSRVSLPFEVLSKNSRTSLLDLATRTGLQSPPSQRPSARNEQVFAASVTLVPGVSVESAPKRRPVEERAE